MVETKFCGCLQGVSVTVSTLCTVMYVFVHVIGFSHSVPFFTDTSPEGLDHFTMFMCD